MRRQLLAWCIFLLCVGLLWHEAEGRSLLVAAEGRQGTLRGQLSVIQGDDGVSYVSLDRLGRPPGQPVGRGGGPRGFLDAPPAEALPVRQGGGGGDRAAGQAGAGRRH